jgi:hypothetical protein
MKKRYEQNKLGPYKLDIQITQSISASSEVQHFNKESCSRVAWLCGCLIKKALFNFPCILALSAEYSWNEVGVTDIKHLSARAAQITFETYS